MNERTPSLAPGEDKPVLVQVLTATRADGKWTAATLELLGDASALARRWGGLVGAWILTGTAGSAASFEELAAHGSNVVWHLRHERFRRWSSEAIAATLAEHLAPTCRIVLLPGDARGEEVAAQLAVRLDTAWIPDALTLTVSRGDVLEITATQAGGRLARSYQAAANRPAIVTMRAGVAEARKAASPGSLRVYEIDVDLSNVPALTTVERFLPADPRSIDLVFAERIVAVGRGSGGAEGVRLVGDFADALGASLGASRMAVDLGWARPERQVGQTGRTVRPDLYVACGISGASHHLAGMRDSKHIVALNPDAAAPIHSVAHLSLLGDLHRVIPAIQTALQRRAVPTPHSNPPPQGGRE